MHLVYVNVGECVNNNDSGVLANSGSAYLIENEKLAVPSTEKISGCALERFPFFLVGDEMFPLKT